MTGTLAPTTLSDTDWSQDPRFDTVIHRRKTRSVRVGDIWIGSEHPVVVQSMINEDTLDVEGATAGILRLHQAGCEIVRLTVPSLAHAKAVGEIRQRLEAAGASVPLVADVHHNGMKIALEVAKHVDKVRINPGLFVFDKPDPNRTEFTPDEVAAIGERITETFEPLVRSLKEQDKALRIGVNHGSLAERMLFSYGDTPLGMVESALEFIRICDRLDFHNIVISMKASRAPVMFGIAMAAMTAISTVKSGAASLASTQARAGVSPSTTQASQTVFISLKSSIEASQMVAEISFDLSLPASASRLSISARIASVWRVTLSPGACMATWPAV